MHFWTDFVLFIHETVREHKFHEETWEIQQVGRGKAQTLWLTPPTSVGTCHYTSLNHAHITETPYYMIEVNNE